jgi:hypothetical protein
MWPASHCFDVRLHLPPCTYLVDGHSQSPNLDTGLRYSKEKPTARAPAKRLRTVGFAILTRTAFTPRRTDASTSPDAIPHCPHADDPPPAPEAAICPYPRLVDVDQTDAGGNLHLGPTPPAHPQRPAADVNLSEQLPQRPHLAEPVDLDRNRNQPVPPRTDQKEPSPWQLLLTLLPGMARRTGRGADDRDAYTRP